MARGKRKNVTDQVSDDEVTPRAKPRPRKKQAVTKTNSAAVKALIRKNATTSPFLLLPSEVRENILIHLLGDNLIHLKYLDVYGIRNANYAMREYLRISAMKGSESKNSPSHLAIDCSDSDDGDGNGIGSPYITDLTVTDQICRGAFRHAICVAQQSEQIAYEEAVSGDVAVSEGESPEHYIPPCKERHAACRMCGNGPWYLLEENRQTLRVDLNVLGVCRQLYEEGNHLLWATNTFSFDDPKTFAKFLGSLNPAQKRNVTSIHISTTIGGLSSYYQSAYQRARWDDSYWGTGLKIANLNMLRGVQTLHLCLNQGSDYVSWRYDTDTIAKEIESSQEADVEVILRLRALRLKHATVIVSDDGEKLRKNGWSDLRWTAKKKNEYAESIRTRLMVPNGAELVRMEAEAANLARKTEIRDNAAARLKTYRSILKEKRADAARAAKWASRQEAKAVVAAKAATQLSAKSWKKATELQNAADKQKDAARHARASADSRLEKEKDWQEQVANAREKLKRAMAKLGATPEQIADEALEKLMEGLSGSEIDDSEDDSEDDVTQDHESVQSEDVELPWGVSEDDYDEFFFF